MFGGSFAFAETLFPTASQEDDAPTQNDVLVASNRERELQAGILTLNIALIKKLFEHGSFRSGNCDAYDKEWQFATIVGFIQDLDIDLEQVWIGRVDDATGAINFRYEESTEYDSIYAADMRKIKPPDENYDGLQLPVRLVGLPQVIDGDLCFLASFARPATATEYVAVHQLEAAAVFVKHGLNSFQPKVGSERKSPIVTKSLVDPYNDEPIAIDNADVADLLGTERLARVIWKFVKEESAASVMTTAIRAFCQSKWDANMVNSKLDEMEESGVLFYVDPEKSRVQLVE